MCLSCNQVQQATDAITQPSAREVYARSFDKADSLYLKWNTAFAKAYKDTSKYPLEEIKLELPHTTVGQFSELNLQPLSYTFKLSQGEILIAEVSTEVDSNLVFLDLFEWENDSLIGQQILKSSQRDEKALKFEVKKTANYVLLLHPELEASSSFSLKIYSQPQYQFPVSNKGNKAVQSFWGDSRGGGKRSHKGIDIFASRGTPVIASTNGIVTSTGERGLGGKQVWIRDGFFGQSLYYAHLDSIIARSGQRVKIGDTLGLVVNTGNARTTPPHLHFGIYNRSGAVNPYPFVKHQQIPKINDSLNSSFGIIKNLANLRLQPNSKGLKIAQLNKNDSVQVVEKSSNWLRVSTQDSFNGYIYKTSIKLISSN
ncbi:murein DD-endopeptidase MepM/ murein hydrolase activator NlpD [Dokdonia sp. Hel_I_53]|nr:murein DD-endopeptidase MepM/ murein hydrolase activator NlpD [Dokdonia sp. Hel_I_53]